MNCSHFFLYEFTHWYQLCPLEKWKKYGLLIIWQLHILNESPRSLRYRSTRLIVSMSLCSTVFWYLFQAIVMVLLERPSRTGHSVSDVTSPSQNTVKQSSLYLEWSSCNNHLIVLPFFFFNSGALPHCKILWFFGPVSWYLFILCVFSRPASLCHWLHS